ncbi:MAG: hypothetical protein ACK4UZ_05470 [Rhizobium rhizophilum]
MRAGDVVLVDTTLLIEAHRTDCLAALAVGYRLQTVEKCVEETQNGTVTRSLTDRMDETLLRRQLDAVHSVTDHDRARVAAVGGPVIDDGERDLWAHALGRIDTWILCGPDRASMRFGVRANQRDRLVALEPLLKVIGHTPKEALREHYRQPWLDDVINKAVLGIL